jgi:GNAT superfamily N-acetyltransferase
MTIEAGPDELYTTLAKAADVPALVALVNGAYRGEPSRRGWTSEADLVAGPRVDDAALAALVDAPDQALLVLRAQSGLFACAHVAPLGAGVAALRLLAVRPALQGNGTGRRLLAAAERAARERFAAQSLDVAVLAGREELLAWLERRGYRPSGATRAFAAGDAGLGSPRRGDLEFLVLRGSLGPGPGAS